MVNSYVYHYPASALKGKRCRRENAGPADGTGFACGSRNDFGQKEVPM